jgi:hypothetical protein
MVAQLRFFLSKAPTKNAIKVKRCGAFQVARVKRIARAGALAARRLTGSIAPGL